MLHFFMLLTKPRAKPCRRPFEVYEDMVEILPVLEIFLTENSWAKDLLCGVPSCSEACLFFNDDLFRLWLQSVQYYLQHDFAWVTDEDDSSVVLALLQVAFLEKCDDQGLGPRGWPFSCLQDLVEDCGESGDCILSTCFAGMLSTPADFPFFNNCTAASTSLRRMGWSTSVFVWVQFSTDGFPLAL